MNIVTLLEVLVKGLNEAEEKFFENIKDFYSFETAVKGATESFAASYLGAVLSSIDEQISKDAWRKDKYNIQRHDTRTIISSVGDVTFDCTYYQSRKNKKEYHYLIEELLGVSAHERFSEAAEEKILTEALKTSYEEATKVIPSKSKITKTTVMNKVHSIAKELPKEKPDKLKKVPYLFIEADEDHVAEQHGKWGKREDNVGFISKLAYLYEYKQDSPKCKGRKELVNTFYFGGVYEAGKGVRKFWENVFEYIKDNYDYENINKIYIIGDGGVWIKSGVNYVPGAQFCADKFHLMKYINKASNQMLDEAEIAKEEIYRLLYKKRKKQLSGYFADGSRRYPVARLRFNVSNGEVRGMSLFALLYPSKTLSDMYLPIESLNNHESLEVIEKSVRLKLKEKLAIIEEKYGDSGNNKEDARWYYLAPMLMDGVIYAKHWIEDIVWEMNTDEEDTTSEVRSSSKDKRNKGFIAHIDKLRSYLDAPEEIHLGRKPEDLLETLVNMVLGSPAICIYRSNGRSTARATSLAKVFVNNFNLPESTAIIDLAYGRCRDDNSHWQNVLKYCKDGCFQAMIDEYIHMLKETAGFQSDGNQYQIVHDMMMDSLKIHTATYIADTYPDFKKRINGADRKSDGCRIRSSYAVGFTKDAGDNSKVVMRKENIRNAFNSPMRPFVLATTSIGQEGLDFHNYCRVIMHWNLPSNPIDVGRILRTFKIKKNVEVTDNGKDNF